jgi:hypothetical protein
MNISLTSVVVLAVLLTALALGRIRGRMPEHHLQSGGNRPHICPLWGGGHAGSGAVSRRGRRNDPADVAGSAPARNLSPDTQAGNALYFAIQAMPAKDEAQRALKAQAMSMVMELAQLRALLMVQSTPSVSNLMLVIVVSWLVVIFLSFSLLSHPMPPPTLRW